MQRPGLLVLMAVLCAALALTAPPARAADAALMSVDTDAASPGPQASGVVLVSSPEIAVDIDIQNAGGIGAFEFEVLYDPAYLLLTRWAAGPFLASTGRTLSCQQVIEATTVRAGCGTVGADPPGPSGDGVLATVYFRPRVVGQTCLLMLAAGTSDVLGNPLPTDRAGGCLTISPGDTDSDGDGCWDETELGPAHLYGGGRDPANPWDFYDVPVPALHPGGTGGRRDRSVGITDAIAVLAYIGTVDGQGANANDVLYNSDLNANGVPDGREYDRSIGDDPSKPWRTGPPDGAVTIKDVILALNQVGDHCT